MIRSIARHSLFGLPLILILSLNPGAALAADVSSCQTLGSAGETYTLTGDVSASGTCFRITAPNVRLDGRGHRVTYSTSAHGNGVRIEASGAEVFGLTVVKGAFSPTEDSNSSSGTNAHAVFSTQADASIHDVEVTIDNNAPQSVKGLVLLGSSASVDIRNNTFNISGSTTASAMEFRSGDKAGVVSGNTSTIGGSLSYNSSVRSVHVFVESNRTSGRLRFTGNTFNSGSSTRDIQHFQVWESSRIDIDNNTLTDDGGHYRMVLLDGCVDCTVHDNLMVMRGEGGPSAGIRLRHSSRNNELYGNVINASGCSGDCHTMTLGRGENVRVHHNVLTGQDPGGGVLYLDEGDFSDYQLYNNAYTVSGGDGAAIRILMWEDNADNISFNYETITNSGTGSRMILFQDTGSSGPTNVTLCQVAVDDAQLVPGQIADNGGVNDWSIDPTPCADGCCYGIAGDTPAGGAGGSSQALAPPSSIWRTDTIQP